MRARSGRWAGVLRSTFGAGFGPLACAIVLVLVAPPASVDADDHTIVITDSGFEPDELTVFTGEPVKWTNATSGGLAVLIDEGRLDSGPIGPGEAFSHVFEAPGTIQYSLGINPNIAGTIVVLAAPATAPGGSADIVATPAPSTGPASSADSGGGGTGPALLLAVAVVGAIAIMATIAGLIGASRRPGR